MYVQAQPLLDRGLIGRESLLRERTIITDLTTTMQVAPTEIKEIVGCYEDKSEPKKIQTNGFRIAGEKYMTFKAEDRSIYGRKVGAIRTWIWR